MTSICHLANAKHLAHIVEPCSYDSMRTRTWTWWLSFTKLLACLASITLLWGCGTPYVIVPSASELPSSLQMQMEAEREGIPDELRGKRIARNGTAGESGDLRAVELKAHALD